MVFFKRVLTLIFALCSIFVLRAEEISFKVDAPMIVSTGEPFRVEFQLNAKPDRDSFVAPKFDNFDVMAGPSVSQGSSVQIINGSMTKSVSYNITYVLMAHEAGTYTIPAATIVVNNKSYTSQSTAIEVRSGRSSGGGGSSGASDSMESRASNTIGREDLLLRLELDKREVYRGEPIRAALKLYSRVDLAGSESSKMPTFNGFWSQDLKVEQGPFRGTLNGKVYNVYNVAEYLLYPQQGGELTIDPAELTVVVQVVLQTNRGFDPFFGGGNEVHHVRRVLKTEPIVVDIKEFPAGAPSSFAGAVGEYAISQKLSSAEVAANSAITLQLTISGTGNINFVQAPKLALPTSFELYDVKREEKITSSASGSVGYRQFDYPFIVRAEGEYDIQPIEFTYFDLNKQQYVTLSSAPLHIVVTPDKSTPQQQVVNGGVKREDVRLLGSDIRFIKTEAPRLRSHIAPLVLSPIYFGVLAAILFVAVVLYFIIRKYMRDSQNVVLVKGKRANKVAIKRLRIAERYMREQDRRAFYEEMLRALWGYLSDKLNIPVADLTKENIREELARRGVEMEADSIITIIQRCEEAQYSPSASVDMSEVYGEGIDIVSKIESAIKR